MFRNLIRTVSKNVSVTKSGNSTYLRMTSSMASALRLPTPISKSAPVSTLDALRMMSTDAKPVAETKVSDEAPVEAVEEVIGATETVVADEPDIPQNESVLLENGDEELVVYELDDDVQGKIRKEIKMSLMNLVVGSGLGVGMVVLQPGMLSSCLAVLAGVLAVRGALRAMSLRSMPMKITLNWPATKTFLTESLNVSLNLENAVTMSDVTAASVPHMTEQEQRDAHNNQISEEKKAPTVSDAASNKLLEMAGNDPTALMLMAEPSFDKMLIDHVSFREVIENWRNLEDPDFPETASVVNMGLFSPAPATRIPLTDIQSLWFDKVMPEALPFINARSMETLLRSPYETLRYVFVMKNAPVLCFGKYVMNMHAFNQLIFAANLNSRKKAIATYASTKK